MSIASTRMPSVAAVVEVPWELPRGSVSQRTGGLVRAPWARALLLADLFAAVGTAAVVSQLAPAWWPVVDAVFVVTWLAAVAATGGYTPSPGGLRHPLHVRALVAAGALVSVVGWAVLAVSPELMATGTAAGAARYMLLATVTAPALSTVFRLGITRLAPPRPPRVVLAGHAAGVRTLLDEARRTSGGPRGSVVPVGICLDGDREADLLEHLADVDDVRIELGAGHLMELVREFDADAVVVAPGAGLDHAELRRWGTWLQDEGVDLLVSPGLRDVATSRLSLSSLGGARLLRVRPAPLSGPARVLKNLTDRVVAAALLALLAPLLAVLAVLIRRDSPGPALYRQTRVGLDGRLFSVLKLRTMCQDADRVVDVLADSNESDRDGVLFKIKRDPRITRLGATLRKYSLDELPQLVNVVRGEMSLIGPRPALPSEVSAYGLDLRRRLVVKPGLTGLWQVSGRSDLSWEETVRLDLQYVDNWSWGLDASIALRTVQAVMSHRGAY
jgi:exopolysaccharide biosynthesis polyprenyl glycosylphosphotransferase